MRTLLAALIVLLAAAPAATAEERPYLSVTEAKRAVVQGLEGYTLNGFTERSPHVQVRCHKTGRDKARCRATFSSDRLSGTVRARVREEIDADGERWHDLRLSALHIVS